VQKRISSSRSRAEEYGDRLGWTEGKEWRHGQDSEIDKTFPQIELIEVGRSTGETGGEVHPLSLK
jgi:hypothetical protein